jgi:two-component system, cell cycle response regulator DivK
MAARSKRAKSGDERAQHASKDHLILIADDSVDNRTMYFDYLIFAGYRVVEAKDGLEAIKLAAQVRPDLIVMDLSMPKTDGWSATTALKKNPETQAIKILALTGHAFDGAEEGARKAGCDGYVRKPCLPEQLAAIIASMLSG